jgi:hypothetical protein
VREEGESEKYKLYWKGGEEKVYTFFIVPDGQQVSIPQIDSY